MISDKKIKEPVGLLIRHEIYNENDIVQYEYGKIVEAWFDQEMYCIDCRIQIYEKSDPINKGNLLPGTLRYFLSSLTPIDEIGNEIKLDSIYYKLK